ncbi:PEP-CTERM sorting domain-containing protein [Microcoleus sp. OTE_8_concoct_300]|uniref:PEP-CTERM sorting domain-containing protein n=1 Tax=Microcoleus sp. OTE_8_concoct_300 TaxID=2964710 RepID=UPI00403F2EBD
MRGLTTWFQPETRLFILLFKAVEEGSIFINSSSNLIALTFVSVYIEDVKEKNQIPLYLKIKVPRMKSPLTLVKSLLAVAGVAAVSAVSAAPAWAFSFGNIAGGDTPGDAYINSFTFDVVDQGESVLFNIKNSGDAAAPSMFISQVFFDDKNSFFDDDTYLSNPLVNRGNVGLVDFIGGASNDQLPQGGNGFTTNYAFSRKTGDGNAFGIQGGESLGLSFTGDYNLVMSALNSGALKIGLHVQALPNGASDSYISSSSGNTQDTPEPLTMLAAGAAVGFGTMFKKQRERAQKAQ